MLTDGGRRRLCRLDKLADSSSAPRSLPIRRLQRSAAADDRRVDVQQPPPSSSSCRPAHVISIPALTKICTLTAPCTGAFSEMYALAHAAGPASGPTGLETRTGRSGNGLHVRTQEGARTHARGGTSIHCLCLSESMVNIKILTQLLYSSKKLKCEMTGGTPQSRGTQNYLPLKYPLLY